MAKIRGEPKIVKKGRSVKISLYCEECGELIANTSGAFPSSKLEKQIHQHEHGTPVEFLPIECPVEGCDYQMTERAVYPPHALSRHFSNVHKPLLARIENTTSISIRVSRNLLQRARKKDPNIISHIHDEVADYLRHVIKEGTR